MKLSIEVAFDEICTDRLSYWKYEFMHCQPIGKRSVSLVKTKYKIILNEEPKEGTTYLYKFGHTPGIKINVIRQEISIEFEMTVKKSFEDISELKLLLVPDALRKAHLLHALDKNEALKINEIIVFIGEESRH